jgi:hypothetical protein
VIARAVEAGEEEHRLLADRESAAPVDERTGVWFREGELKDKGRSALT